VLDPGVSCFPRQEGLVHCSTDFGLRLSRVKIDSTLQSYTGGFIHGGIKNGVIIRPKLWDRRKLEDSMIVTSSLQVILY